MSHPSKRKGDGFEREVVDVVQSFGFGAKRAPMSDGRNLDQTTETDVLVTLSDGQRLRLDLKRRAKIAEYMTPPADVFCKVLRADHGQALAVVELHKLLTMLRRLLKDSGAEVCLMEVGKDVKIDAPTDSD